MEQTYDLVIIGSGPGGYVAAIRAAQLGLKVVCIDKNKSLGGTCLNIGCIPSKCLLRSTELYHHLKDKGHEHGFNTHELTLDFPSMMKRKDKVVQSLTSGIEGLFQRHGVQFIEGTASFIDPFTVKVSKDGQSQDIKGSYFIIATGSEPVSLPILPFDEKQVVSSTGALSLSSIPERLIVIGGGVIGVELASVYSRLGSEVTVIEMLSTICPNMDEMIQKHLLKLLAKQGMNFLLSTQVTTAVVQPNEIILTVQHDDKLSNLSATTVLVAVGRRPYTERLNLSAIQIETTKKGFIPVDASLRTKHSHIFAIGDVIEGVMLAHRASEEGMAVAEFIAGKRPLVNYLSIPNVIYTFPEAASVGLTEQEAKQAGLNIKIGTFFMKGNARARCNGETEGLVKIIGEQETDRLIGLHIIGEQASELIQEGMIGIEKKVTLDEIGHSPHAHPTLSESIKEAALSALERPIHA